MDITQLLNSEIGNQIIKGIGQQAGTSEKDTASVVNAAGPLLMGMMKNNAASQQGASSLMGALQEHDGSVLDNISGFLGGGGNPQDGNGILSHILGGQRQTVENSLSEKTGVSTASVSKILVMLAPIVMGYLGKQSRNSNTSSSGGLGDLLGSLMGGSSSSSIAGNILSSVLGGQGGGLGDLLGGGQKKSGGLGDMLGGILGKK